MYINSAIFGLNYDKHLLFKVDQKLKQLQYL